MKLLFALSLLLAGHAQAAKNLVCTASSGEPILIDDVHSVEYTGHGNLTVVSPKGTVYLSLGRSICELHDAKLDLLPALETAPEEKLSA